MSANDITRLHILASVSALCIVAALGQPAMADDGAAGGALAAGPNPDYGMAIGNWLFYPELFVGVAVSDNPEMLHAGGQTSAGPRVKPSFQAVNDTGLNRWQMYAGVDAQFYQTGSTSDQVQARVGVADVYQATPDLTINALADYTRQIGLNSVFGLGVAPVVQSANNAASTSSLAYNQYTASLSAMQKFDRFFVQPEAQVQALNYEDNRAGGNDSVNAGVGLRVGYDVMPDVSVFVDPSYQGYSYRTSSLNTNGYRVVAGVSSKRFGLFAGELYAGYESQSGASAIHGSVGAPVFGGTLFYYPTEQLNFALSANQSVGSYGVGNGSSASYSRSEIYELDGNYTFSPYWTGHARAAYDTSNYSTFGTHSDMMIAGLGFSYAFWHNVAVTAEYQYTKSTSNTANTSWDENLFTIGLTYRY